MPISRIFICANFYFEHKPQDKVRQVIFNIWTILILTPQKILNWTFEILQA